MPKCTNFYSTKQEYMYIVYLYFQITKTSLIYFKPLHNVLFYFSDFDKTLKRPVSSRYGTGLFSTLFHPGEGKTFNVNISYR